MYEEELGRVVGSRIYSGEQTNSEGIITELRGKGVERILDGDIYISTSGNKPILAFNAENEQFEEVVELKGLESLIVSTTYSELVQLRDKSLLIPGIKYRITDYVTKVREDLTEAKSAEHPFDLVVTALTTNSLDEEARALVNEQDDNYFAYIHTKIKSASWKPGVTINDIDLQYTITADEEIQYRQIHESAAVATELTTKMDKYGNEVPAIFNPSPDEDPGNDLYYLYCGQYSVKEWVNHLVSVQYTLNDRDEVVYGKGEYHPEDVFVELAVENGIPVLYKNDIENFSGEGADYADRFEYVGDMEIDGVPYNKWHKINVGGDETGYHVLTQVIVVNGQFTITQEQLTAAIGEETTVYDMWEEYGKDGESINYYHLTSNLVDAELEQVKEEKVDIRSWEIKYCLDNDRLRFNWADTINGKGVIYYLKDENGNETYYDFKNIQFKRYMAKISGFSGNYDNIAAKYDMPYLDVPNEQDYIWVYTFYSRPDLETVIDSTLLKGQVYNNKIGSFCIQSGNVATYKLNNICIKCEEGETCKDNIIGQGCWDIHIDGRNYNLRIHSGCNIITILNGCYSSTIKADCTAMLIGEYCNEIIIEDRCYTVALYGSNDHTIIGEGSSVIDLRPNSSECEIGRRNRNIRIGGNFIKLLGFCTDISITDSAYITITKSFSINIQRSERINIGANCRNITIYADCHDINIGANNTNINIGLSCYAIELKYGCIGTHIGSNCGFLSLGLWCVGNTFGEKCSVISLGTGSSGNIFGNNVTYCYFDQFRESRIGNDCNYLTLKGECSSFTIGEHCSSIFCKGSSENVNIAPYSENISIGFNCDFFSIISEDSPSSSSKISHIVIEDEVGGDPANRLNLTIPRTSGTNVNQTIFKRANSTIIEV